MTGYYADEEAGCQVFHVCHDVLVSSFLCPVGSTFSQKLLTCDWWNKVDCSDTRRYVQMDRNNYQIDDDEMIRNAYAMISLQSTEDVTKDGLVDPDNGARIIDYSILGGRTMSYTSGLRKITDYPSIDSTGNDLPSSYDDYSRQNNRDRIFDYDRYQQKAARTDIPVYRSNFKFENKVQSPYHASPVIGQDQTGNNDYQDSYNESDGYTHGLQSSYAPTVPTVTTTTRRFYSPTVPTTNRPSTLPYSKLDLLMDSSDHLYTQNKNSATPPTMIYAYLKDTDRHKESQTRSDDRKKSESAAISWRENNDDRTVNVNVRTKDDGLHHQSERKSETNFRINVTDTIDDEDKVFRQQNDRPVMNDDNSDERLENIEMEDSIGIYHAVNDLSERSLVRNQDSIDHELRYEILTTPIPLRRNASHSSETQDDANTEYIISISKESNISVINETTNNYHSIMDYDDIVLSTTMSYGETAYTESFDDKTIPLLTDRSWHQQRNDDETWRTSTISTDVNLVVDTTESINETQDYHSLNNANWTDVNQNSSSISSYDTSFTNEESNDGTEIPKPSIFFQLPAESFLINVPDEIPSSFPAIDENTGTTTTWNSETSTTEVPLFSTTLVNRHSESSTYNGNIDGQSLVDYEDEVSSEVSNSRDYSTERDTITEVSTQIPWLVASIDVNAPETDILPPIVDYEDDFAVPDSEDSEERSFHNIDYTERQSQSHSETVTESPCHFSSSTNSCETIPITTETAITQNSQEEITSLEATTKIPHQSISLDNAELSEKSLTSSPNEFSTTIVQPSLITIENNTADDFDSSTLRTVTPRDLTLELDNSKETATTTDEPMYITTVNSLLYSNHRDSLKQHIEKTIDQHNYPYQVSLIAKTNEDATTTSDYDTFGQEFGEESISTLKDNPNDYDTIRSVEPEDEITTILQPPRFSDIDRTPSIEANDTVPLSKLFDSNMSSLLQLMADLLKLDRLPRPFATKDLYRNMKSERSTNLDAVDKSLIFVNPDPDMQTESESANFNGVHPVDDTLETLPDSTSETDVPSSVITPNDTVISEENSSTSSNVQSPQKQEILEQLTENFGQPLYDENPIHGSLIFDLPREQRELDFETGLPIEETKHRINETEKGKEETSTSTVATDRMTTESEGEKSIVETELVPSIGFSFDTDEDREEYAEAVLGGIINEHSTSDKDKTRIVQVDVDQASTTRQDKDPEAVDTSSKSV